MRATHRQDFYQSVAEILRTARANAYRAVNFAMVEAYWNVGQMIVEEEQRGQERAEYGAALLKNLSIRLTAEFGASSTNGSFVGCGSSTRYSQFGGALRPGWHGSLPASDPSGQARRPRMVFEKAAEQNWSTRALERQISSLYYERLLMSRKKARVIRNARQDRAPQNRAAGPSRPPRPGVSRHPGPARIVLFFRPGMTPKNQHKKQNNAEDRGNDDDLIAGKI